MIAADTVVKAEGWSEFDAVDAEDRVKQNSEHLQISHDVAKLYQSKAGKKILSMMVNRYLLTDIVTPHDTQFAAGIKQGKASVVKEILAHIEISNNS